MKAALAHRGTAMLDVISPCVTFNDHEGSTKSFAYVKDHAEALEEISFVPAFDDIVVEYAPGTTLEVKLHDGSRLRLSKLEEGYDPRDKARAVARLLAAEEKGEVLTGLFYVNTGAPTFLDALGLADAPLATQPEEVVRPSRAALQEIMVSLA